MNMSDDEIKEYYSEWWENPKDIRNVVFDSLNELVRRRIPSGEEKKALDIGSGRGRIVSYITKLLLVNISNRNSFHAWWVNLRGWRNKFVFNYIPEDFDRYLEEAGFRIVYRRGIGLVTPISLFSGFKGKLIPIWFAKMTNKLLDHYAITRCHLYYVEAISRKCEEE